METTPNKDNSVPIEKVYWYQYLFMCIMILLLIVAWIISSPFVVISRKIQERKANRGPQYGMILRDNYAQFGRYIKNEEGEYIWTGIQVPGEHMSEEEFRELQENGTIKDINDRLKKIYEDNDGGEALKD